MESASGGASKSRQKCHQFCQQSRTESVKKSFVKLRQFSLDNLKETPDSISDFSANAVVFKAWQKEGK
jgi:hypothetical protein